MIQRSLAFLLLLVLAACSSPSPTATVEASPEASSAVVVEASPEGTAAVVAEATVSAESTEASSYQFELNTEHSTPLSWGGTATFDYPADWRIVDTSQEGLRGKITIYGPDNYNISIAINNDPANTANTLENVLNTLNQTAAIDSTERDGRTIYYTPVRGGNALAAAVYVEGTTYALVQMLNTSRLDLEPMQETAFSILLTVRIAVGE